MGRIVAQVRVENPMESDKSIVFSAMVDTGATYLTLPTAWKDRLGKPHGMQMVDFENATQDISQAELCGPYAVTIGNFRRLFTEVLFIDMHASKDEEYEPLIGYIPLEQSQLAVDMLGHRLVKAKAFDLK
jgi:hypothetical protein